MKRKSLALRPQRDPERIQREFKQVRALLKYGVVALTVFYTVHGVLMQMGIDHWALHIIGIGFIMLLGWKMSHLFNLCLLHRLCVVYMCAMASLALHGRWHCPVKMVTIVIGLLLIILLLWQQWKERKN